MTFPAGSPLNIINSTERSMEIVGGFYLSKVTTMTKLEFGITRLLQGLGLMSL